MRKPITELITENVQATLQAIDISDIYPDITIQAEIDGDFEKPEHFKIVIIESSPKVDTTSDITQDERKMVLTLNGFVMPAEGDSIKPIQYMRVLAAAIETEIMKDITRGGNAGMTKVTDIDYIDGTDVSGVIVTIEIDYAYPPGRPFVEVS